MSGRRVASVTQQDVCHIAWGAKAEPKQQINPYRTERASVTTCKGEAGMEEEVDPPSKKLK